MDLVKDPIPQLIRQISIPASIGFFFNTMFNIVDTFFAGLDSTDALAALAASFPIFFIILALGGGIGQGATALIANAIGEGQPEKAHHFSLQSVSFGFVFSLLLTAVGLASAPFLLRWLGAEERYLHLSLAYPTARPKPLRRGEGPPAPSGNLPDGTGGASMNKPGTGFVATLASIPLGRLPSGAGW